MAIQSRLVIHLLAAASICSAAGAQPAGADAERSYRAGTGLLNRGMNDLAAEEYRSFLRDHPESPKAPQARYGLAVCLVRLGKHADAAKELESVVSLQNFEFAPDAQLLLAQCDLAAGDAAGAVRWLTSLLEEHPDFAAADAATALLGEAQYSAGNISKARASLTAVIEKWPKRPSRERAEYLLALCDAGSGKDREAADRLASWKKSFPQSVLTPHASLVEAQCLHRLGESDLALEQYTSAAQTGNPSIEPDALLGKAQLLRAAGRADEARSILSDLSARYPKVASTPAFVLERSRCLIDAGKNAEALGLLAAVPKDAAGTFAAELAFWRARCELNLGHADTAAAILQQAAADYPKSPLLPDLLLERGAALTAAGHEADAAAVYQVLAEGDAAPAYRSRAALAQAGVLHRLGKYDQSLTLCREYLASAADEPAAADVRLLIAENEYLLHEYGKAEQAYADFLSRAPSHAQAWRASVRRGLCLVQLQRPQEAAPLLKTAADNPSPADPALARAAMSALGDLAFAASDWPAAEKWYRGAAKDGPDASGTARLKLALSLQRQARVSEAVALFQSLSAGDPPTDVSLQATFELGQALVELGRLDDARAAFEQALAAEEKSPQPRFRAHTLRHLAAIASSQGREADAAALLDQLATAPGAGEAGAEASLDRAGLLLGAGDFAQAEAALAKFIKSNPRHPRAGEARAQHAIAVCRLGRLDDALREFDALAADGQPSDPTLAAAAAYERAWALSHLKRATEAAAAYEALLTKNPPARIEAHAALELAQLTIAQGDFAAALPLLERSRTAAASGGTAELASLLPRATYLTGVCQLRAGQPADTVKTLASFATDYPQSDLLDSAAVTRGEALLATGRAADAAREFRAVAERTTDQPLRSAALLRLGEAAAAAQDWPASERAFARHRELFADSDQWFRAAFGIGWALENAGKRDEAIAAYRTVVEKHDGPTAARAQFQIGECLYGLGRLDDAVRELLKVDILYQYPQWSAAALYEAGRCLAEQKKHTEAIAQFEQVTTRFPDSKWAKPATEAAAAAKPASLPGRTSAADPPASLPATAGRLK